MGSTTVGRDRITSDWSVLSRLAPVVWRYRVRLIASIICAVLVSVFNGAQLVLVYPALQRLMGEVPVTRTMADASVPLPGQGLALKDRILGAINGVIDRWGDVSGTGAVMALGVVAGLLVITTLLKCAAIYGQEYLIAYCSNRVALDLRSRLFGQLVCGSMRFHGSERIGELLTRLGQDVDLMRRLAELTFGELLRDPLCVLSIVVVLLVFQPGMALAGFAIVITTGVTINWIGRRIKRAQYDAQGYLADQASIEQECFANIRVVKAFGMEEYERSKFEQANVRMFLRLMKMVRAHAMVTPLMEGMASVGIAALLLTCGYFIHVTQTMTGAQVLAFLVALGQIYQPCKRVAKAYNKLQQGLVGGGRVLELLDRVAPLPDAPGAMPLPPFSQVIRFDHVWFRYTDERDVLCDVTFEVRRGEVIALVGPSGAGKSTLMDLLLRFYDPVQGRILIDGHDLRNVTQASWREQVAFVPQEVQLFNDTVEANIAFGRTDISPERVREAARRAQADEFIRALPDGYRTVLGERGLRLSGGQRQRLAIARALAKDPAVLIFDEATSSLDTESEHLLRRAMRELFADRTVFLIAHRFSTVMDADRIVVLNEGRVVDIGPHAQLLERCPLYQRLYALQLRPSTADAT